ncbi:MAG TPA: tetratricopeptide repeat protein, partial [Pyrinomonadaceae bacterium]|nr:tetratricopeptide repeat protein [Pyrinomonadaceae bacterium]
MPNLSSHNIPSPANWQDFESLCRDLWSHIWNDPYAKKNGRSGQKQNGVDIWGRPHQGASWVGIQCKGKDKNFGKKVSVKELIEEANKAKTFEPKLSHWILVTTGEKDVAVEQKARELTVEHLKQDLFAVDVLGWNDIVDLLGDYEEVIKKHYKGLLGSNPFIEPKIAEISRETKEILTIIKKNPEGFLVEENTDKLLNDNEINLPNESRFLEITLDSIYQGQIDNARDLVNNFQLAEAISILNNIKSSIWNTASSIVKFRLLANLGWASYQLEDFDEAARYFIEAFQYNSDDEKALINVSLAYILLKDFQKAEEFGIKALEKNPANTTAYAVMLQLPQYANSVDAAIDFVPNSFHEKSGIAFVFGLIARKENRLNDAISWFEKAEANDNENFPNIKGSLATAMLESLFEKRSEVAFGQVNEDSKKKIIRIIELYTNAWNRIKNSPLNKTHYHWIINRSIAKRLNKDFVGAKEDLEYAKQFAPTDPLIFKHLGLLESIKGNFSGAESLLKSILDSKEAPESVLMLADVLMAQDKFLEVIDLLENFLERTEIPRLQRDARQILIEIYSLLERSEDAERIYKELIREYPNEIETLTASAQILINKGDEQSALEILIKAKEQINSETSFKEIISLGDEFFRLKQFAFAADCFRAIANPEEDTSLTRMLLRSSYKAGDYNETLKICRSIRAKYGIIPLFIGIEATCYEEINDLQSALEAYQEYFKENPDNLEIKLRIAWIHYRRFNFDEVDQFLKTQINFDEVNLEIGYKLVFLYCVRNQLKEGFDLMYELRRKYFNEPEAHLFYVTTFFNYEKNNLAWLQNKIVSVDSAVCLEDQGGRKEWFVIEERSDINFQQNEISSQHKLAQQMIGKRKGDEVATGQTNATKEISKISEIKSKYVYALHETMGNYEKRFPDHGGLFQIYVGNPENPKEFKKHSQKFWDLIANNSSQRDEIFNLYRQRKLTVGVLAELLGSSSFDLSNSLRYSTGINFICSSGDLGELNKTLSILSADNIKLVADITSLQLIFDLKIRDKIIIYFGKFLISPTTTDLIQRNLLEIKNKKKSGF